MDMKRNTVSIVMCTYNGESFIREQLDSIMAQTYPVEEIIIQDDCSTDGTFEVVSEYASRYPHIRPIRNKTRKGVNGNFFRCVGEGLGRLYRYCRPRRYLGTLQDKTSDAGYRR